MEYLLYESMMRQALILMAVVAVFGVLVPWYKGVTILQPTIAVSYGLMALLFVAPVASEFWAAISRPASRGAVLRRVVAIVGYGWGLAVVILATALVTLNLVNRTERVLIPPRPFLAAILLFSLTASVAVAVFCALLAGRFSAAATKSILRAFFLVVLLVLAFGSRFLPESWQIVLVDHSTRRAITRLAWEGSAVSAVIAAIALVFLLRNPDFKSQPATP